MHQRFLINEQIDFHETLAGYHLAPFASPARLKLLTISVVFFCLFVCFLMNLVSKAYYEPIAFSCSGVQST